MDYAGRISKHGDAMLRGLWYAAAQTLLTVMRTAHPLKDWARRIPKRSSHRQACVALARKLALRAAYAAPQGPRSTLSLHRMLITGEAFRWPEQGGDHNTVNEGGAKDSGSAQSGNPVPAGTVAEAIPRDLLLGRTNIRDCA